MAKTERDIEQINFLFSKFNLKVTDYVEGTRVNQYRIKFPIDTDVNKLMRLKKNLVAALNDNDVIIYQDGDCLVIETKGDNKILKMSEVFQSQMYIPNNDIRLVLGRDIEGKSVTTNLAKAPHILVSGCTGSGKTQLLHSFISSILVGSKVTHLVLIDPKGNEFNVYKDIDTVTFIDNISDALSMLNWLVNEMDARYKYMAEHGITDASDVIGADANLIRTVCVIDEFADLIKTDSSIEKSVVRIAQKARACGIHLIIGTQYPKSDVITGLIQANIPVRVCLKVNSNIQSRVAMDRTGGERLLGHGDLLFLGNGMYDPIRIQAPFISAEDKNKIVEIAKERFTGMGGYIASTPDYYKKTTINSGYNFSDSEREQIEYMRNKGIDIEETIKRSHESNPYNTKSEPKKRVGLIQGMINLMKVKPVMFRTDDYPPKI